MAIMEAPTRSLSGTLQPSRILLLETSPQAPTGIQATPPWECCRSRHRSRRRLCRCRPKARGHWGLVGRSNYIILYYTILYCTILYYTILYCTILYYTILYYTVLYCTILHYSILYLITGVTHATPGVSRVFIQPLNRPPCARSKPEMPHVQHSSSDYRGSIWAVYAVLIRGLLGSM